MFSTARSWFDVGEYLAPARSLSTSEAIFRQKAIEIVRPICAGDAVRPGTATVGVVRVTVGMSGRVLHAQPLEPSSGPVADALLLAAESSRFQTLPQVKERPQVLSGNLTFYFLHDRLRCDVLEPAEVGYVGRWSVLPTVAVGQSIHQK
jgi:hypothetical protein